MNDIRITAAQNRQFTTVIDRLETFRAAALALHRDFGNIGTEQAHNDPIAELCDDARDVLKPLDAALERLLGKAGRIENHISEVTSDEFNADRDEYNKPDPDDDYDPATPDTMPDFGGLERLAANLK